MGTTQGWLSETDFQAGVGCANTTIHETYTYDALGNLQFKTDRKGQQINYYYDSANRLNFKGWQYANPANNVTYHYDVANRLISVDDAGYTGAYSFIYDNMDRLTEADVAYSFLSGTYRVNYTYDAASNLKTMQDPQAGQNTYNYDLLNRLSQLITPAGTFGFGYDFDSRRTSLTRPNNITTTYTYDTCKKGQLCSILHKNGATTLDGATYSFTYNSVTDNINWKQKTDNRTSVVTGYTYDKIYQLLTAVLGGNTTESYTYDSVGNRLTALSPTGNWTYDNANELNSRPNVSYTYDSNGNTLTKTDATGQTTYAWDFENRLTQVTLPNSGGTASFKYDPFGRRIQKLFGAATTNYIYDGANILEELDPAGTVLARYTQGGGIDEPLSELRSATNSFYESDGLGTVTSLSNSAGALANTYGYDSFGNATSSSGAIVNPFRYTGREFDSDTGLYYYRARYYDSQTGRFLGEDPLKFQAGINFYPYTSDNPVKFVDPSGMRPCSVDVRCWPIEKWNLGALGFKHCFLTVTCQGGIVQDVSAGPDDDKHKGRLGVWVTPTQPNSTATTYGHFAVPCTMVDCITLTAPKFNDIAPYSNLYGLNSNAAMAAILGACRLADIISIVPQGAWPLGVQ